MRIECPSCAAGFEVSPAALEPNGRTVRCAACKSTWFAEAPSLVMADGTEEISVPAPIVNADDRADHEALNAVGKKAPAEESAVVIIEKSPSVVPVEEETPPPMPKRKTVAQFSPAARKPKRQFPLGLVAILLVCIFSFGIASRQSMVRAAPELATLYAAIGFPVNLRGLEFQNIRTRQEIQDGITVLAIEGEVENIVSRAVELPRVRLSVLGDNGVEIYSWTALLPRSILYPHERVSFKSRLASPPAAGKEIMVRFLTRADLTASVR
jgi:predicted Zn finger-like uncharacterized protein